VSVKDRILLSGLAAATTAVAVLGAGSSTELVAQVRQAALPRRASARPVRSGLPTATPPTTAPAAPPSTFPPPQASASPAVAALRAQITSAFAGQPGCAVVMQGESVLAEQSPSVSFAPGSTQKLLVAAAALQVLGPDYRFRTEVVATRPQIDGEVDQLWLVGSGDPVLATPDYAAALAGQPRYAGEPFTWLTSLAQQLQADGVRSAPDGIHGDGGLYGAVPPNAAWTPAERLEGDIGSLGALALDGGFQQWTPSYVPAADPASQAASELSGELAGEGISAPVADDAPAPPNSLVLAEVDSAPLSDIVAFMLRASDNFTAEELTLAVGRRVAGQGTTAAGVQAVMQVDRSLGIDMDGVNLVDGSGLAPSDRATCTALLEALDLSSEPRFAVLLQGLAVAGESGTLLSRFVGTSLQGRLAGKDGYIDGVNALVAQVQVAQPLRFAMIVNGSFPSSVGYGIEDNVAYAVAAYATSLGELPPPAPGAGGPPGSSASPRQAGGTP
jgi:D-alanyl-D-alanine carboxypeptidase/D-alanyl-D-alanine-endopeptidase (penicillin-binding protein 4)